jgi:hypothetical protein
VDFRAGPRRAGHGRITFQSGRIMNELQVKRRETQTLVCIWLLSVLHGVVFAAVTPLWEGFDEPFHYSYVQILGEKGTLPVYGKSLVSKEVTESFRYAPMAPTVVSNLGNRYTTYAEYWELPETGRKDRERALKAIPGLLRTQEDTSDAAVLSYEAQHPPLYYALASVPYRLLAGTNLVTRVFFLRLFSTLLGSMTIFLAYQVACTLWRSAWERLAIPLLIALLPMFYATVGRISNDSLGVSLFGLLMLLGIRYCGGPTWQQAAQIGAVAGLGLLTKAYFLTALPVIVLILFWPRLFRKSAQRNWADIACGLLCLFLTAGWWYLRNYLLYGNVSGLFEAGMAPQLSLAGRFSVLFRVPWIESINVMLRQHVWTANNSFASLSRMVYLAAYAVAAASAIGLLLELRALLRRDSGRSTIPVLLGFYSFFMAGLMYQMVQDFLVVGRAGGVGGWYMSAMAVSEVILVVAGLQTAFGIRWRRAAAFIVMGFSLLLNFLGYYCKAIPFYSGLAIPHFKLWDFFQIYSPSGMAGMLRNLALNKPDFLSPAVIASILAGYASFVLLLAFRWVGISRLEKGRAARVGGP